MRRAVQPQTSTHPTHRRVPPTPNQSLAKHNRKPPQLTENNHQHPKSIASFCRVLDEFTVPPYFQKTKLRALTATSRFEKIANPMKTKEKRFSNRNKKTHCGTGLPAVAGTLGCVSWCGFTSRQPQIRTRATETQTKPANARRNNPNHARQDKDEIHARSRAPSATGRIAPRPY